MIRKICLYVPVVGAFVIGSVNVAHAAEITNFNTVVVLRAGGDTGTGSAPALSSAGAPIFLDQYSITFTAGVPSASLTQSIPVIQNSGPFNGTQNQSLVEGGFAPFAGGLNRSTDGKYLMFTGYNAAVGGSVDPAGTLRRMGGRVNVGGAPIVETEGTYGPGSISSAQETYSMASTNGTVRWTGLSGTNSASAVFYNTSMFGSTTAGVNITASGVEERRVKIFNNQLYITGFSTAGKPQEISTVGTGLPTTAAEASTVTELPGMPTAVGTSPVDFFFADPNTLYVADDRTTTSGGLQKWIQSAGTWSLAYTKNITTTQNTTIENGIRGLDGSVDANGNVILFATTTYGAAGAQNDLVGITDSLTNVDLSNVVATSLITAGANTNFRGVADLGVVLPAVPEPGSITVAAIGLLALARRRRQNAI